MIIESTNRSFICDENYSQTKDLRPNPHGELESALQLNSFKHADIGDFHHDEHNPQGALLGAGRNSYFNTDHVSVLTQNRLADLQGQDYHEGQGAYNHQQTHDFHDPFHLYNHHQGTSELGNQGFQQSDWREGAFPGQPSSQRNNLSNQIHRVLTQSHFLSRTREDLSPISKPKKQVKVEEEQSYRTPPHKGNQQTRSKGNQHSTNSQQRTRNTSDQKTLKSSRKSISSTK